MVTRIFAALLASVALVDLPVLPPGPAQDSSLPPRGLALGIDIHEVPAPTFFGEVVELRGEALVYVVDRSASMILGGPVSRLARAQQELVASIAGLDPTIRFNVVAFDCTVSSWAPGPQGATPEAKASATAWVGGMLVGGGTGTAAGVVTALSQRPLPAAVILLTDGGPNCPFRGDGSADHRRLIRSANTRGVPVHVFGVAVDSNLRGFCQGVAADSGGSFREIR